MRKLATGLVVVAAMAGGAYWWVHQPLKLTNGVAEVQLQRGEGARSIAADFVQAGVNTSEDVLAILIKGASMVSAFKAGTYELKEGDSAWVLVRKLMKGEYAMRRVRIGEGWNIRQVRAAIAKADGLHPDTQAMSEEQLLQAVGLQGTSAEGMFFPDTYVYAKNTSDTAVLKMAAQAMQSKLQSAWEGRDPAIPIQNAYDLLKLASIVEKETGHANDRGLVSAVFNNRLRIGMRLQTDPTVIYGIPNFNGNITKADLQRDTPYNTYTRNGLPPTPIAMPSEAALQAAAHPDDSKALYFVARGDGSGTSEFTTNLNDHNRAVQRFILKR